MLTVATFHDEHEHPAITTARPPSNLTADRKIGPEWRAGWSTMEEHTHDSVPIVEPITMPAVGKPTTVLLANVLQRAVRVQDWVYVDIDLRVTCSWTY